MQYENGCKFHDLTLLCPCGSGSFGEVYLARDISGQKLAVKIISKNRLGDCWQREFKGLVNYRKISGTNQNLLRIYHVGEDEACFYYTMEVADASNPTDEKYLPDTLASRIAHGPMAPMEIVCIAEGILNGLEAIHQAGMSHRDIKPSNIIFVGNVPKIGDIGLMASEQTIVTHPVGTMEFIPPEMRDTVLREPLMAASMQQGDLYALGKVLYSAMTGNSPGLFPSLPANIKATEAFKKLNKVVSRASARDPFMRIRSTSEFKALLIWVGQEHLPKIKRLRDFGKEKSLELTACIRRYLLFITGHKILFSALLIMFFAILCWLSLQYPEIVKINGVNTQAEKALKGFTCKTGEISMKIPSEWQPIPLRDAYKIMKKKKAPASLENKLYDKIMKSGEKIDGDYIVCDFEDPDYLDNITVQIIRGAEALTFESQLEWTVWFRLIMKQLYEKDIEIHKVKIQKTAGFDSVMIDYSGFIPGVAQTFCLVHTGTASAMITLSAKKKNFEVRKKEFTRMLKTITKLK